MLARLRAIWRAVRGRRSFEREMADEMRFHVENRAADLAARGLSADDARRQARLEFGNPTAWQDACRESRRLNLLDDVVADMRFALRGFRHEALLTATVIATLTFGIGVSSGVFTIFSAIGFRPMLDAQPETFFRIYSGATTDRTRELVSTAAHTERHDADPQGCQRRGGAARGRGALRTSRGRLAYR